MKKKCFLLSKNHSTPGNEDVCLKCRASAFGLKDQRSVPPFSYGNFSVIGKQMLSSGKFFDQRAR